MTLHGAFGFAFNDKHFSLSDKIRDLKRSELIHLILVIIDEISMVKADMLYQLDLRLQEIMDRVGVPFGGVSVIAFGDMCQLQPCMGKFICDKPKNLEFRTTHALSPRWQMFSSILLEKNHRQGRDKDYADLLNRVRTGDQTMNDIEILKSRVRPKKHNDLKLVDLYIGCKRKDVAEIL